MGGSNAEVDFQGSTRTNAANFSTNDPEAKLYRRSVGTEARLAFLGHALKDNRCGVVVNACLTLANGHAARAMIEKHAYRPRAIALDADKRYETSDFVNELRSMNVRSHVAQITILRAGLSAIAGRTMLRLGYGKSSIRERIEETFDWMKTIGGMRRPMRRGID